MKKNMKPNERCLQVRDVSEAFVCTNDARKHLVLNKPLERVALFNERQIDRISTLNAFVDPNT